MRKAFTRKRFIQLGAAILSAEAFGLLPLFAGSANPVPKGTKGPMAMMKPGKSKQIAYLTLDKSEWRAQLEGVHRQGLSQITSDPDFFHFRGNDGEKTSQDTWIKYLTMDGSHWSSKCHSHTDWGGAITFTFEHWPSGTENGPSHHNSDGLVFLDWFSNPWIARVAPMNDPGQPMWVLEQVKN